MRETNHIISFDKVSFSYEEELTLNNLSFFVRDKSNVALIGNNGCGKSTTIHILCNLISYHSGDVFVFNRKLTANYVSYKSRLGIVLSNPYFVEDFTVVEYFKFAGKFQNIPKNELPKRIDDLLGLFDIEDKKLPIKKLSSGNKMKVSLAAAMIHNPEILILDEPFVNLDIESIEKIVAILKSFRGSKTLFITSHNLDLVGDLCDEFLIMDKGTIVNHLLKDNFHDFYEMKKFIKNKLTKRNSSLGLNWLR